MTTEYTETYELPSRGFLYEEIEGEVTLRNMKAKEEKMLLGSTKGAIDRVIGSCVIEPENLSLGKLLIPDKYFLLMKLRILSYGSIYHNTKRCPNPACGEKNDFKIDLDEMIINEMDEDFIEPIEFELPMSNDVVGIKILRDKDNKKVQKKAKRLKKKSKGRVGKIEYILRMAEHIVTLNGEEMKVNKKQSYVENLHGTDSAYLRHQIDKIEIGYDLDIFRECRYCGEDIDFTLELNEEFFRPRFE